MPDINFGAPQQTSVQSQALQQIDYRTQPFANKDFVRNMQWLNESVTTLSQYQQTLQKGVDNANQNIIDQIESFAADLLVVIGGLEPTGVNLGDLAYVLQAVGALLGIDPDTPFPLNLLEAGWHMFSNFIAPLPQFSDLLFDTLIAWSEQIGLSGDAVDSIQEFSDAAVDLFNGIDDFFGVMGDMFSFLLKGLGLGHGSANIGVFQELWDNVTGFLSNLLEGPTELLLDMLSRITVVIFKSLTWLANFLNPMKWLEGTGLQFVGPQLVPEVSSLTADWSVGSNISTAWVFDDTTKKDDTDLGSFKTTGNGNSKRVLTQSITPCVPGEQYHVSAWVKWSGIPTGTSTAGACIVFYSSTTEVSTTNVNLADGHGASGGFGQVAQIVTVPINVDGFKIGCRVSSAINTGTVWVTQLSCTGETPLGVGLAQGILDFPNRVMAGLREAMDNLLDFLFGEHSIAGHILAEVIPPLHAGIIQFGTFAKAMVDGLEDVLSDVWDHITGVIGDLADLVYNLIHDPIGTIGTIAQSMVEGLTDALSNAWDFITDVANGLADLIYNLIHDPLGTIGDILSTVWDAITDTAGNLADLIYNLLHTPMEVIGALAQGAIDGLVDVLQDLGDGLNNTIDNVVNLIHDLLEAPMEVIGTLSQNMIDGLVTALDNLENFIQSVIDKILTSFAGVPVIGGLATHLADVFNDLWDKLFGDDTPQSTITAAAVPSLDGSKIGTGSVAAARIASLDAAKITTGSFDTARISDGAITNIKVNDISGSKVNAGTVSATYIASLDASKITTGTFAQSMVTNLTTDLSNLLPTAVYSTKLTAGHNLSTNPSFENTSIWFTSAANSALDTAQHRTGLRSGKLTANGSSAVRGYLATNTTGGILMNCTFLQVFYLEAWVYGKSTNAQTSGGSNAISLGVALYNSSGTEVATVTSALTTASTSLNGAWTKISGYVQVPSSPSTTTHFTPFAQLSASVSNNEVYYFDDVVIREVTDANQINQALYGQNTTASTVSTGAVPSLDASKITTGTLGTSRIADAAITNVKINDLSGSKINTGTVSATYVASLDASKITSGTFGSSYITDAAITNAKLAASGLSATKFTTGTLPIGQVPTGSLDKNNISDLGTLYTAHSDAVGSGATIVRTSTSNVTISNANTGPVYFPTSFFGVNAISSADITVDTASGGFEVSLEGWYRVDLCFKINAGVSAIWNICPVVFKNGSVYKYGADGCSQSTGSVRLRTIMSSFEVYLEAGDNVLAGYDAENATGTISSVLTGEASGTMSYFSISLTNRSLA